MVEHWQLYIINLPVFVSQKISLEVASTTLCRVLTVFYFSSRCRLIGFGFPRITVLDSVAKEQFSSATLNCDLRVLDLLNHKLDNAHRKIMSYCCEAWLVADR